MKESSTCSKHVQHFNSHTHCFPIGKENENIRMEVTLENMDSIPDHHFFPPFGSFSKNTWKGKGNIMCIDCPALINTYGTISL